MVAGPTRTQCNGNGPCFGHVVRTLRELVSEQCSTLQNEERKSKADNVEAFFNPVWEAIIDFVPGARLRRV